MLTFTSRRNLWGKLTGNNSSANLTDGDTLLNQFDREIVTSRPWSWREKSKTGVTVASQQFYDLPFDCGKLISVTITSGTTVYTPKEISSTDHWNKLNQSTSTANYAEWFYPFGDQVGFYPTPSTAGLTITFRYLKKAKDLSVADYTTGTITTLANAGTAITGSSTVWTAGMAGRYIQINEGSGGDGVWYEIDSFTSTTALVLARAYDGIAISAGSATYIIGQVPIIPEDFQILSVYRALEIYFSSVQPEKDRALLYKGSYKEGLLRMQQEFGSKTTNPRA
jgi:hypothetical protein